MFHFQLISYQWQKKDEEEVVSLIYLFIYNDTDIQEIKVMA